MGNRVNTEVTSGQLLPMSNNQNTVVKTVSLSQPVVPQQQYQHQQQQQQQPPQQRKPTQVGLLKVIVF